jgi:hypothetical protein
MKIKDYSVRYPFLTRLIGFVVLFPTIFGSLWALLDPLDPFGIELLEKFGVWGYVSLLIVSFCISLIATGFFLKQPRKNIPKIDTVLRKGECKKKKLHPKFFRTVGPFWIDFERGYVFRRDEIDEIIGKLKKDPLQVVEGQPASGKSVLIKHIGHDLQRAGFQVFYLDCKYELEENLKVYFEEALEGDSAKILLIIDNYHLHIDLCENFLQRYRNFHMRKTKLLIASRPVTGHDKRRDLEIEHLSKSEISTGNIAQNIVCTYLKEGLRLPDDRIEEYSLIFREYEGDLWYLSWALKTFNPGEGGIDVQKIYEEVHRSIREIEHAAEVFFPLAILNRFEIPVEKRFLTQEEYGLNIEEDKIDHLVHLNEIVQTQVRGSRKWTALSLYHSSLAALIYETYLNTELAEVLPEVPENYEKSLLLQYLIHSDLMYYVDTVSIHFEDFFGEIIRENLSDERLKKKIVESIQYVISSDKPLEEIELYLYGFMPLWQKDFVRDLKLDQFVRRIQDSGDIDRIASLFGTIQGPFLKVLLTHMDLHALTSEIKEDIFVTSALLGAVANTDRGFSRNLVHQLGKGHISVLFDDLGDEIQQMGHCYGLIAHADDTLTSQLLKIINTKLKAMSKLSDEDVDEIPDQPGILLDEVLHFFHEVAEAQELMGRHHEVIEKLVDTVEETVIQGIHEAKWGFVENSGGDLSESLALEHVVKGVREEMQGMFAGWNEGFQQRVISRFNLTSKQ